MYIASLLSYKQFITRAPLSLQDYNYALYEGISAVFGGNILNYRYSYCGENVAD